MKKTLTTAAVEKRKAGGTRREVPDGGCPGLHLIIQPSGAKSWAMRFRRPDGRPAKLTLGPVDLSGAEVEGEPAIGQPLTLPQARQLAVGIQRDRAMGKDVVAARAAEKRRRVTEREAAEANSFGRAARKFVLDYARPKTRSWATSAKLLGLSPASLLPVPDGLCDRWATRPIASITAHDVHDLVDEIRTRGVPGLTSQRRGVVSDSQARVSHARLSKFFSWAIAQRLIDKNPCTGAWRPDVGQARERVLSDDEIRWFWQACDSLGQPFGPILKLLLLTGQRRDEVAGMTRAELDLPNGTWSLPASRTKNNRPHTVPLPSVVRDLIQSVPTVAGKAGYVFTTNGRTHVSGWGSAKRQLDAKMLVLARAEDPSITIPPWRIHDLRRSCASGLQRLRVPLPVTERLLNHVSGSFGGIVGVYQRDALAEERATALERWAERVAEIVSGEPAQVVKFARRSS